MPNEIDDAYFMNLALEAAKTAAAAGEVPVGAVVVRDGTVLATAANAPIGAHDPTAHAEIRALREAALRIGNYRLTGCTLYVTLEPCMMCAGAMVHARISRLVYGADDPKTGAAGSVFNLVTADAHNHQISVTGGICQVAAGDLLRDFFRARRCRTSSGHDA